MRKKSKDMNSDSSSARNLDVCRTTFLPRSNEDYQSTRVIDREPNEQRSRAFTDTDEDCNRKFKLNDSGKTTLSSPEQQESCTSATNGTQVVGDFTTVAGSNVKVDIQYLPKAEGRRFDKEYGGCKTVQNSLSITTTTHDKLGSSNKDIPSARSYEHEHEDKEISDFSNNRKLNILSFKHENGQLEQREFTLNEKPNKSTVKDEKDVCSDEVNIQQSPEYCNENKRRTQGYTNKKVFTFVRPSPRRHLGSDSSVYSSTSMSKTRKLASLAKFKSKNVISASEPYLKDLESSVLSPETEINRSDDLGSVRTRPARIYEGARFLVCKSSWKRSVDSFLIPQESLCYEDDEQDNNRLLDSEFNAQCVEDIQPPAVIDDRGKSNHENDTFNKDYHDSNKKKGIDQRTPNSKGLGRFLERQQAFEDDTCYDYLQTNDTLNLLKPIIGVIIDNECSINEYDPSNGLSYDDRETGDCPGSWPETQPSSMDINNSITEVTGGNNLAVHWKMRKDDEAKENAVKITSNSTRGMNTLRDGRSIFDQQYETTSLSYPCLRRRNEILMKRESSQGNEAKPGNLLSKCSEGTVPLDKENNKLFKREDDYFIATNTNTKTYLGNSDRQNDKISSETLRSWNLSQNTTPDILNKDNNNQLTAEKRHYSLSEPMLGLERRQTTYSAPMSPKRNVTPTDDVTTKKPDENTDIFTSGDSSPLRSPKKRNRVKLALATSHAGIYVTGDSQDDASSDSPMGCSFEKCPSWVCNQSGDSPFLSPYYQPSTSSNEDKEENLVIFPKRKVSPISITSTRQTSNSSEKDSCVSLSPHSKTSGYSVQDSGFEASGRHSTALLSPSFRKMTMPMPHPGTSTSGEMFSSEEFLAYHSEDGTLSPTPSDEARRSNKRRKVAIGSVPRANDNALLSPTFKAKNHDNTGNTIPFHPYRSSNSSEGDSGLDTPRSSASQSPRIQRDRISTHSISSARHRDRSSRFSIQSKLSSKSSVKSGASSLKFSNKIESFKGSVLSFLSTPKTCFGSRKTSDGGKSSCGSKSLRKQLSDFPDDEKILILNVSGRKFKLHEYFTTVYPETLLGNTRRNEFYDHKKEEFFFDRDPDIFRHIWNFYYTGKLHFPKDECVSHFVDEISFFGVADEYLCSCCWEDEFEPAVEKLEKLRTELKKREQETLLKTRKIPKDASLRQKIWLTTKDPVISTQAKVFYLFSMLAIVVSTIANITETIPCSRTLQVCKERNQGLYFYIDSTCVAFFTFEYLLRLITAPKRLYFVRKFMSVIDLLAILPFYFDILFRQLFGTSAVSGINFLEILRILRIVRVFKLMKHSRRLQSLVYTFKSSTTELGLIVFIYLVLVTVFASVIYYAEMTDNPKYSSIPESMWYAVITTTTTGYGDIVPETILGKLIGCACCLLGVLIVALPVPILQMR